MHVIEERDSSKDIELSTDSSKSPSSKQEIITVRSMLLTF